MKMGEIKMMKKRWQFADEVLSELTAEKLFETEIKKK